MPTRIFLNLRAQSPAAAAVRGPTSLIPVEFPAIVAGNKVEFRFFLVDGYGNYDADSGDATFTVKLALGDIATRTSFVTQTTSAQINETIEGVATSGWKLILDTNDADVLAWCAGLESKPAWIELQITDDSANIVTSCQHVIEVRNRIIS